jgi:hypothetical protein
VEGLASLAYLAGPLLLFITGTGITLGAAAGRA